ncbi:hypothetical protein [Bogoriella caseilytica]|uniref:PA domain-containing protein n=1 Tax=Bogoriella caseilytica TaxID=56055 RepID=A0A3N2BF45_9MICO|nr:hypothetical protein [Bogoriella caseilytica]ROR73867.1 hypothetical protein EDD31_2259 [Bogoriella caseilytica]
MGDARISCDESAPDRETAKTAYARHIDRLNALGPRRSGNAAHRELIDDVAADLAGLGYRVERDTHTFERWDSPEHGASLAVETQAVEVSSPWPYSGETGPEGVSAPLILVSPGRRMWASAAGHIAVVEVENMEAPASLVLESWGSDLPFEAVANPVISTELAGIDLRAARSAGVVGVVAVWRGLSDHEARGQYLPFTRPHQEIPAVWVPDSEGDRLVAAARRGAQATLVLDATRHPGASMDTVWAVSPGAGPHAHETVIVVTHSDGGNAVEENGFIGLLALARDAAESSHDRTLVFVMTAGHLRIPAVTAHGQATTAWLDAHPELWDADAAGHRAVAGLVIEHLGARRQRNDSPRAGSGDDGAEPELLYATTRELDALARAVWHGAGPVRPVKPGALVHLGEGEPLFENRIPAIALVTGPASLLAETPHAGVDLDLLSRQVESFRALQRRLTAAPDRRSFGTVRTPGRVRKLIAGARVTFFLARQRSHRATRARRSRRRPRG